jgi:predicted metal-binding membrane protein
LEAAQLPRRRSGPFARGQLALVAALLALAILAWIITDRRMGGMESGPGMELGGLGFYVTVWVVMMAAMMFPSVAPTVVMYERLRKGHRARGRDAPAEATALFVAGYLLVWTAVGVLAYGLLELVRSLEIDWLAWDEAGRWITGGVIVGAAAYELTPFKEVCLVHCRSPMMFLAERWRNGRAGALRLGAAHGAWCTGCCWALMAALFAVGVMSLGWMALIAAFIAGEKLLPWPVAAKRTVAVALLLLGLAVALVPEDVPGFTIPDEQGMHDAGGGAEMEMSP